MSRRAALSTAAKPYLVDPNSSNHTHTRAYGHTGTRSRLLISPLVQMRLFGLVIDAKACRTVPARDARTLHLLVLGGQATGAEVA